MGGYGGGDLFSQAVAIVKRDRKASTSYIQRRLQIGYNRAASLMEKMELEGIVGAANHSGKREILVGETEHATYYLAHVLSRKTGIYPRSSPGQAFCGTCSGPGGQKA